MPDRQGVEVLEDDDEVASPEFHLDQALTAFSEARDRTDGDARPGTYGVVLHDIAQVHEMANRPEEALDLYREAAGFKRRAENSADLAVTLAELASCLIHHGGLEEASSTLDEASELLSRPGVDLSLKDRAVRIYELGGLYERLGGAGAEHAYSKALGSYTWALQLTNKETDPLSYGSLLHAIGDVHRVEGRLLEAAASHGDAVHVLRTCGDSNTLVSALIALGRVHRRLAACQPAPDVTAAEEAVEHVDGDGALEP